MDHHHYRHRYYLVVVKKVERMNNAIIVSIIGLALTMLGQAGGICYFAYKWGVWTGTFTEQMNSVRHDIEHIRDEMNYMKTGRMKGT